MRSVFKLATAYAMLLTSAVMFFFVHPYRLGAVVDGAFVPLPRGMSLAVACGIGLYFGTSIANAMEQTARFFLGRD